jgi:ABC-type antimicrobial peptide transport system permease subunit
MALGARRSRIVRQLVIESVPIVVLGVLGKPGLSRATVALMRRPAVCRRISISSIEWRTVVVRCALGALALAVVGLLPAWKVAQQHLIDAIKDGGQNVSRALDRT